MQQAWLPPSVAWLLQVLGSRRGPLHCVVGAQSIGPMLEFGADLASMTMKPEMAFGNVEVLQVWQMRGMSCSATSVPPLK